MKKKGKKVSGDNFVAADEIFDRARDKKEMKGMKTPGIAVELKLSQKDQGYSKKPRVRPEKKNAKLASGQRKVRDR